MSASNDTKAGIHLMPSSQLDEQCYHSLLISLVRALAALQVAAAHLRATFFPDPGSIENPTLWYQALACATGFAHLAVVMFFVISGWLVGGSFLNQHDRPDALRLYAIDRVTRLWTVLLPAFLLIVVVGIMTGTLDPRSAFFSSSNAYSATSFAGNLLGVQTIILPTFGNNFPLWSLANGTWYYVMFPLMVMTMTPTYRWRATGALVLCGALLPLDMVLYFCIWLLGAAFARVRVHCGVLVRALLLGAALALCVHFRMTFQQSGLTIASFPQDVLITIIFLLFLSSTVFKPARPSGWLAALRKWATLLANFSFTLYVVHVPAIGMAAWLGTHLLGTNEMPADRLAGLGAYLLLLAALLLFSYGFYWLFEARTFAVRRWLKDLFLTRRQPDAAALVGNKKKHATLS